MPASPISQGRIPSTSNQHGVRHSLQSMRTHYHLGNYLIEGDYYNSLPAAQQIQERNRGISELKKSIDPNHARSNYFIGQILQISSKPEVQSRAQHYLDKAMLLDPKYAQ